MKTKMFIVSSYEIEGGLIRVGEKSPTKTAEKNTFTMDEAIAKLRRVLREMKEQDKIIYGQLMTLNSNIGRLKSEIKGEKERKEAYDMELEYEYDTFDSDESCSDFEISDIEEDDTGIRETTTNLSSTEANEEADRDSIHERYDSGIQEDASYSFCQESNEIRASSETLPKQKPLNRTDAKKSWNGERSSRYDFLLSQLSSGEDSQSSFDYGTKRGDGKEKANSEESVGGIVGSNVSFTAQGEQNKGKTTQSKREEDKQGKTLMTAGQEEDDKILLQRSYTIQPRNMTSEPQRRIQKHRRSQSEDQIRLDLNSNVVNDAGIEKQASKATLSARERYRQRNLDQISEDGIKSAWNAFDARNYRSSERGIRKEIPLLKQAAKSRQFSKLADQNRSLNGSLTQLNIEGAISNSAIKAIKRSASVTNCSVLTIENDRLSGSLTIPKEERNLVRLRKTASAYVTDFDEQQKFTSGFEVGYRTHANGMVTSTISLV